MDQSPDAGPVRRILRTLAKAVKDLDFAVKAGEPGSVRAARAKWEWGAPGGMHKALLRRMRRTRRDALPTIQKKGSLGMHVGCRTCRMTLS